MNIVATELQTSYKRGRSTSGVLSIISQQIKTDGAKHIIMIDPSNAFDPVNRELLRAIMNKKGLPLELIKMIRSGHEDTKLRPKAEWNLGGERKQQSGVSRNPTECDSVHNIF